jgi:exoribonuclease R
MYYLQTNDYINFKLIDQNDGKEALQFTGSKNAPMCLLDDTVDWNKETNKIQLIKRAKYPDLVGLINLQDTTIHGFTSNNSPIYIFYPFDQRYPPFKVGCSEKDRSKNRLAIIRFLEWNVNSTLPRGSIQRILGPAGDFTVETQSLLYLASPYYSNKINLHIPTTKTEVDYLIDYTWKTINIDPPDCKDIDDVISLKQISDDLWHFAISIADVDNAIQINTINNDYALTTTQTIYLNGTAVRPMLPYQFSEGICSLIPGQERYTVSLFCSWIPSSNTLIIKDFKQTKIINQKSFTYESIYSCTPDEFPTDILKSIITKINPSAVNDSHKWIEELMILYNKEAAKILVNRHFGILRAQSGYKKDIFNTLSTTLKDIPDVQNVISHISINAAKYIGITEDEKDIDNYKHFMISNELYCHATSPIRRYCDLFNQRILKNNYNQINAELIANYLNERNKVIKKVDRDIFLLKQLESQKIIHTGIPLWKNDKGFWKIWVPDWNRLVTYKPGLSFHKEDEEEITIIQGIEINFRIYYNPNRPNWKERLLIDII